MGIIFVRARRIILMAVLIYMASVIAFIVIYFVVPPAPIRWALAFLIAVTLFVFTRRAAMKGHVNYMPGVLSEYFLPSAHFRFRAYRLQTYLGAAVSIPSSLVIVAFTGSVIEKVSMQSLLVIWILSTLSLCDLFLIKSLSGERAHD
jgi:hypothetical protein